MQVQVGSRLGLGSAQVGSWLEREEEKALVGSGLETGSVQVGSCWLLVFLVVSRSGLGSAWVGSGSAGWLGGCVMGLFAQVGP